MNHPSLTENNNNSSSPCNCHDEQNKENLNQSYWRWMYKWDGT